MTSSCIRSDKAIQFMRQARFVADEFSKDRSTKVGCLMLDPEDYSVLTSGYNGMPRGIDESREERHERPMKYAFFEHAERNAIFNAARRLLKGSIAVTTEIPDIDCARALVSVGVSEVFFPLPSSEHPGLPIVMELFQESSVQVHHTWAGAVMGEPCRHFTKVAQYVRVAKAIASTMAKDPCAGGTLFLSPNDYTQLTQGYSGLPRGADDNRVERYVGAARNQWVESSVRNAIYNLMRPHLAGSVALVTATTCVSCARALASTGVREVVYVEPSPEMLSRWGDSFKVALEMMRELGIQTTALNEEAIKTRLS